jgi:hypothetical protein
VQHVRQNPELETRETRRKLRVGLHTKSPTFQRSTASPHVMLRITSGARYCNGMAFPLCWPPIRP